MGSQWISEWYKCCVLGGTTTVVGYQIHKWIGLMETAKGFL